MKASALLLALALALVLVLACLSAPCLADVYSGSLSYAPPAPAGATDGLYVSGYASQWPSYTVTINWTVSNEEAAPAGAPWKYTYGFNLDGNQGGAISHIILEAADNFTAANLVDLAGASASSVGLQRVSSGNPGMPEDFYGLRFDPLGESPMSMTWSFFSDRAPEWGDFFARCGNRLNLGVNIAYNYNEDSLGQANGFLDPNGDDGVLDDADPLAAPAGGSINFHILTPSATPEPVTLSLLALGGLGLLRRRRNS